MSNNDKPVVLLMNKYKTISIYGTIIALSVSLLGAYGFLTQSNTENAISTTGQSFTLLGHVTLTVTDPQGHIKEYRQGDNTVVTTSKSCTAKILFGGTSALCANPGTATWDTIGIGSGGSPPTQPATSAIRLVTEYTTDGLDRASASSHSVTLTDASGTVGAIETIQSTFTNTGSSHNVNEAGLFNGTSIGSSGMFAAQTFSAITLNTNDVLTVKWTITIG